MKNIGGKTKNPMQVQGFYHNYSSNMGNTILL
mgnify:CR=1 FL=1